MTRSTKPLTFILLCLACTITFAETWMSADTAKDKFDFSFSDVQESLVVIEHEHAVGSGFIAKMDDRYYIFTNQHVILGGNRIRFKTASGKTLKPQKVELSAKRDIARLLIDTDSGLEITDTAEVDAPIGVFGNSDGAGVATELYGQVTSIGNEVVEVSADFVSGNSGSPVLNQDKQVIGIASYVSFSVDERTKKGKEPKVQTRRYCYRLTGTKWQSVNWKQYNEKYGTAYLKNEAVIDEIFDIIWEWFNNPFTTVSTDNLPEAGFLKWAKNHNHAVNRIERMAEQGSATKKELDNTNKRIRKDLIDSAQTISKICDQRARQMRFFSQQKELTGFLREHFIRLAERLDNASKLLDEFAKDLESFNYFRFK